MTRLINRMLKPMAMKVLKNEMEQLKELKDKDWGEKVDKARFKKKTEAIKIMKDTMEMCIEEVNDIEELKEELTKTLKTIKQY